MVWDLIGACVPRLTTVWNLTQPPLRYRWFRRFRPLFRFHRHREPRVKVSKIIGMLRS